jgi:hypothetical protein
MKTENKPLPIWSKALILLVLLVFGGFLFVSSRVITGVRSLVINSTNADYIKRCAQKVAPFPEPLPAGYEYTCGVDIDFLRLVMVAIDHKEDQQKILFLGHLQDEPDAIETKQLLDRAYDFGITTDAVTCKFTDVKTKGDLQVGTDKMLYMTGDLKDQGGNLYQGVVGCVRSVPKKKTVLVYSLSPQGKALNLDTCFNLLKSLPSL